MAAAVVAQAAAVVRAVYCQVPETRPQDLIQSPWAAAAMEERLARRGSPVPLVEILVFPARPRRVAVAAALIVATA